MNPYADRRIFWLPNLTDSKTTSEASIEYNCFAWAFGDESHWFDPRIDLGYYWPIEPSQGLTVQALTELFGSTDYETCADGSLESGYEKVVIYAIGTEPTHAARQLHSGRWTSKLGNLEDIEHASPEELHCGLYGQAVVFMRRRVAS